MKKKQTLPVVSSDNTAKKIVKFPSKDDVAFQIVGIGASAGGLEAFEEFFHYVGENDGIAFVLVTHLDPIYVSQLTEILQRSTIIPVVEATDQLKVEPNCVYVIPPNHDLEIFNGRLQLSASNVPHGQRRVIDCFFQSLAEDQTKNAVGILLSGMGSDGIKGLQAILERGGVTLVQDPATAKYESMPSSAIEAGCVSHVATIREMPELLRRGIRHFSKSPPAVPHEVEISDSITGINRILMLLRSAGHDFTMYKTNTIRRRIERRMAQHHILDVEIYAHYLKKNPNEIDILTRELLVNVTSFFRDKEAFDILENEIALRLSSLTHNYRVWVAGCSTGEEAYSVAIILQELMAKMNLKFKAEIYSTDLNDKVIAIARTGLYSETCVKNISPERLHNFFTKEKTQYRIKKEIREMVVFAVQNVIKDPPFVKLDLLCCRNLMIYLTPTLQNQLVPIFHYALKPDSLLFLSPSESVGNHSDLFLVVNRRWKLYAAKPMIRPATPMMWSMKNDKISSKPLLEKGTEMKLSELMNQMLVQFFAPAAVITDMKGEILYVHGDTNKYLTTAQGVASFNIVAMAHEGLKLYLHEAITQVVQEKISIINQEVDVKANAQGSLTRINLSVRPVLGFNSDRNLLLITFQDIVSISPIRKPTIKPTEEGRVAQLERDIARLSEGYSATVIELQTANQELMSANEESQSTNEEMQSTNEELETSKEELQSMNEELISVNSELRDKIEQLTDMQNDIKNLLENINSGVIFLDQNLIIRRFTNEALCLYNLIDSDVGRPLKDIRSKVEDIDLTKPAQGVLDSLMAYEREIQISDSKSILVRIQPYRTLENTILGVVMTLTDITTRVKMLELQAQELELKQQKQALADAKDRLYRDELQKMVDELSISKEAAEKANVAKSAFLATMSHELRTPLNAILGFSELMSNEDSATTAQKETLGIIKRSGSHLLNMINDVLDISKIEAGRLELNIQAFDLIKFLRDIDEIIRPRIVDKHLEFDLDIAPDMANFIKSDSGKLRQVLINLLGNAIKFTKQGRIILRAHTQSLSSDEPLMLTIEVIDSGVGIPADKQQELFKPFVQLIQENEDTKGTGLGLAISKALMQLMGGTLSVSSEFGSGSTFRIELPVTLTRAEDIERKENYLTVKSLAPEQPRWRLLVVDDSADNRLLLSRTLMNVGFDVREAENGQEAVSVFEQWHPHLIWMDMRMPVMDGYEATSKIRRLTNGDKVKIIALTASAFVEQRENMIAAGCDAVLNKPFKSVEIFATLAEQLGVKFAYQDKDPAMLPSSSVVKITAERVSALPLELRQQLHEAASELDIEKTDTVIAQIRVIAPDVATDLEWLVKSYQFEHITQLLEVDV